MAPDYDSDSGSDIESFTTTNVLLGYASKEPTDDNISQLGGQPSWLESKAPSVTFALCGVCQSVMALLLQLHADLPEQFPGHERRLHVFACKNKACRRKPGSVKALRTVRASPAAAGTKELPGKEKKKPAAARNLGSDIFGGSARSTATNANPFATSASSPDAKSNPFASNASSGPSSYRPLSGETAASALPDTFAAKARLNSPPPTVGRPMPVPWPSPLELPVYPRFYLDAEYEALDKVAVNPSLASGSGGSSEPGGAIVVSGEEKEDKEAFESIHDRTFQKFADRVSQNPEQVLRYEFSGQPLLYSDADTIGRMFTSPNRSTALGKVTTTQRQGDTGFPRCQNCGARRVFEVQLMPQAILELESEEEGLDGMEWGTMILGVCEKDCEEYGAEKGGLGFVEEWVGVQWEEVRTSKP